MTGDSRIRITGIENSAAARSLAEEISRGLAQKLPITTTGSLRPTVVVWYSLIDRLPETAAWNRELAEVGDAVSRLLIVVDGGAFCGGRRMAQLQRLHDRIPRNLRSRTLVVLSGRLVCERTGAIEHPLSAWMVPLLPDTVTTVCVGVAELAAMIITAANATDMFPGAAISGENLRRIVVPGPRRMLREVLQGRPAAVGLRGLAAKAAAVAAACGIRRLLSLLWPLAGQVTVRPKSARELLETYNYWSRRNLQLAGWNNGVVHFGWQFPERTVVSTALSGRHLRLGRETVSVDAGLPLKQILQVLHQHGRTLPVVPNFSWISIGTAFFVPVHGSGQRISTLGAAIESALLYDADERRFLRVRRGEQLFRELMYDRSRPVVLLRLKLRTTPLMSYTCREERLESPSADQLLEAFADPLAANIEIRKARAADSDVMIRRFDAHSIQVSGNSLPRDRLGSLWDRIEETPLVGRLFHWFVRRFAFHVELLMTAAEFRVFWQQHSTLPLSKIQLRRMLRDGIEHSACRDQDCICADLFMLRGKRHVFTRFIAEYLPGVRTNPGKQSL